MRVVLIMWEVPMFQNKFCAHRGVSKLMPENSLPSFAAAASLGADEIEFDVRITKDNQLVVCHDPELERISDGCGNVSDFTLEEVKKLNLGLKHGWMVRFCTPEEVFSQFANKLTFNIHLKQCGEDGFVVRELAKLIEKYNAHDSVYFAGSPNALDWMERIAPDIRRVAIQVPSDTIGIFEMAKKYHCSGVQFWHGMFDKQLIDDLHNEGIWCNVFYTDDMDMYKTYFAMGIDTILTDRMDIAAVYRNQNNM